MYMYSPDLYTAPSGDECFGPLRLLQLLRGNSKLVKLVNNPQVFVFNDHINVCNVCKCI